MGDEYFWTHDAKRVVSLWDGLIPSDVTKAVHLMRRNSDNTSGFTREEVSPGGSPR